MHFFSLYQLLCLCSFALFVPGALLAAEGSKSSIAAVDVAQNRQIDWRKVGLRLHSASGGRKSPDFCSVHAVNQGIDIPRSPMECINFDRAEYILHTVKDCVF